MKFHYFKIPLSKPNPVSPDRKEVLRPIIPIEIKNGEKSLNIDVLIDSGSDDCLFSETVGTYLGIDIKSGIRHDPSGIAGETVETYFHEIIIVIGGWKIKTKAGFLIAKDPKKQLPFGILGHNPIFEKYKILFNRHKEEIEFKPI